MTGMNYPRVTLGMLLRDYWERIKETFEPRYSHYWENGVLYITDVGQVNAGTPVTIPACGVNVGTIVKARVNNNSDVIFMGIGRDIIDTTAEDVEK